MKSAQWPVVDNFRRAFIFARVPHGTAHPTPALFQRPSTHGAINERIIKLKGCYLNCSRRETMAFCSRGRYGEIEYRFLRLPAGRAGPLLLLLLRGLSALRSAQGNSRYASFFDKKTIASATTSSTATQASVKAPVRSSGIIWRSLPR